MKEEFPHWLKETDNDVPNSMTDAERKLDGVKVNGPQRDKPCLRGLDEAGLKPVSSAPETRYKIGISLVAFQKATNKGPDQPAHMRRLVFAFVVCKPLKTGFLASRPKLFSTPEFSKKLLVRQLKLTHCMLGNFACFFLLSAEFFSKCVLPDLGPNCSHGLSAEDTGR